jgi:hypothetical protein
VLSLFVDKRGLDIMVSRPQFAPARPIILGTTGRGVRRAAISALIDDAQCNAQHTKAENVRLVPVLH